MSVKAACVWNFGNVWEGYESTSISPVDRHAHRMTRVPNS